MIRLDSPFTTSSNFQVCKNENNAQIPKYLNNYLSNITAHEIRPYNNVSQTWNGVKRRWKYDFSFSFRNKTRKNQNFEEKRTKFFDPSKRYKIISIIAQIKVNFHNYTCAEENSCFIKFHQFFDFSTPPPFWKKFSKARRCKLHIGVWKSFFPIRPKLFLGGCWGWQVET